LAVVQGQDLGMPEHFGPDRPALRVLKNVLGEMPVEIAFREGGVVARQHAEHLLGIARRKRVRLSNRLGPRIRLRIRRPHPDRPDVLLRHGARRVDADVEPVLGEIAVLMIAPERAPGLRLRHHRAAPALPHHGIEVARFLRRQPHRLDPPAGAPARSNSGPPPPEAPSKSPSADGAWPRCRKSSPTPAPTSNSCSFVAESPCAAAGRSTSAARRWSAWSPPIASRRPRALLPAGEHETTMPAGVPLFIAALVVLAIAATLAPVSLLLLCLAIMGWRLARAIERGAPPPKSRSAAASTGTG